MKKNAFGKIGILALGTLSLWTIQAAAQGEPLPGVSLQVIVTRANIRDAPSINGKVLASVEKGEWLSIFSLATGGSKWYKVRLNDVIGWMHSSTVQLDRHFTVIGEMAPRSSDRFTIKGETNYTAEPPADYKGPVVAIPPSSTPGRITKPISGGVLNGKAISLVRPVYPAAARAVRASGAVSVQVLIGEEGNVISAAAVSGHPLLRAASVAAAKEAKFPPTILSGQPVKVSGIITYNFVP